ncbi:MAG: Maf family nucleotide pyrophosphatase [Pseudomonadota bacterium]|nr:Maf family nucleotide pyrophosphatase [Pseudomonadota bacterium]
MKNKPLVLASSSLYRQELLKRLRLPFTAVSPDIDESPAPGETPPATALRLAEQKARALAARFPDALIIGSDQVAELDGLAIGKPGDHAEAVKQLTAASAHTVYFHTALCLLDAGVGQAQTKIATNEVKFRALTPEQIERYLLAEKPYDCAGSAKSEGLGITLIESIRGDDPNALIGLPLIELTTMLMRAGAEIS